MTHSIGDRFEMEPEPARMVLASVEIAAPPDAVFRALADPRALAAWLGGADPHDDRRDAPAASPPHEMNPGGSWLAHVLAPDGMPGTVSGEYLYVVPPRSLTTTWAASWNRFVQEEVSFQLVPIEVGGTPGTRVTVTHRRRAGMLVGHTTVGTVRGAGAIEDDIWPTWLAQLAVYVATWTALARWGTPPEGDATDRFDALHRRVVAIHQGESA